MANVGQQQSIGWSEVRERWDRLRRSAGRKWGLLEEEELARVNGERDRLVESLCRAYGIRRGEARYEIEEWLASLTDDV